jgi:hypothetical protein
MNTDTAINSREDEERRSRQWKLAGLRTYGSEPILTGTRVRTIE